MPKPSSDALSLYSEAVCRAIEDGIKVQELDIESADVLLELELINHREFSSLPFLLAAEEK